MKRVCAVFFCLLTLIAMGTDASAQGLFGGGEWTSGLGLPCSWGSGGIGMPSVYVGWLESPRGSTWSLQRRDHTGTAAWPLRGLWLGVSKEFMGCEGLGLLVSGSLFLPRHSYGTWVASPRSEDFKFEVPSYDWWSLDALAAKRISGGCELLAGMRWDHSSIRIGYYDNTDDDYILNAYIPLVGMQMAQRSCAGSLVVRVVGTPVVFGNLTYNFWTGDGYNEHRNFTSNNSYFVELFAEYSRSVGGNLVAGAFAKWNALSVRTEDKNLRGSTTEPISWSVNIQSLVVGGSLSLGFTCPL